MVKLYCKKCGNKLSYDVDIGYGGTYYCENHEEVKIEVKW